MGLPELEFAARREQRDEIAAEKGQQTPVGGDQPRDGTIRIDAPDADRQQDSPRASRDERDEQHAGFRQRKGAVDRKRNHDGHHVADRLGSHAPDPGHAVAEDHEGCPGQQKRQTEVVQQAEAAPKCRSDEREAEQRRHAIPEGAAGVAETGERGREGGEEQRRRLHARY